MCVLLGSLVGTGCGDSPEAQAGAPSDDIPESEYDLFASLVRNIDSAERDLELARQTQNKVTIANARRRLESKVQQLARIFVIEKKFSSATVERWKATVRGADSSMAERREAELRGAELLDRFRAVGASGRLDADGNIIELDCKNIPLPKDLVVRIANCRNLKKLILQGTKFEDAQFEHLLPLTQLTKLDLSHNQIHGDRLSQLVALTQLEELDLSSTLIDDEKVPQFEALGKVKNKIRNIDIENTQITLTGYEKITRAFRQAVVKQP
jgi:uncharacterized protein YjbI with pentapeptide repeats